MNHTEGFYTLKGYELLESAEMTNAMEDYLEMIYRLALGGRRVRVSELSRLLHVRASSVSKMVQQLSRSGFLRAEKYGEILLTDKGQEAGSYLLYRHDVVNRFLCLLNHSDHELEQAEKIEHFLDRTTVSNLELLNRRLLAEL